MKTRWVTAIVLAAAASALGAERHGVRDGESPRATDLLRAERLAEQARQRLALPQRKTARWVRGGSGWTARAQPEVKRPPRGRSSR